MKLLLVVITLLLIGCGEKKEKVETKNFSEIVPDTIECSTNYKVTTIQEIVDWANNQDWTDEEATHFDNMNEKYSLLIRGSERELDTIVNHYHFYFTIEQ
ncbi:MAG: hypothetical protein J6H19_05090 [Bacteroidaceae bacterium]|nr:hypothetical protein [Bacteroidaceae bacterium]